MEKGKMWAEDDGEESARVESSETNRVKGKPWLLTTGLLFSFFALGTLRAQDGLVFLDLLLLIDEDIERGSLLFLLSSFGYLVGSLVSGFIFSRFHKELVYFIISVTAGLCCFVIPFCPSLILMGSAMVFRTLCAAFMVSGGTFIIAFLWQRSAGPFIQATFFMFAIGGFAVAFITKPFLLPENETDNTNFTSSNPAPTSYSENFSRGNITTLDIDEDVVGVTQVYMSFVIVGIIVLTSSVPFLISIFVQKTNFESPEPRLGKDGKLKNVPLETPPLFWHIVLYGLIGLIYCTYGCLEKGVGTFLMPFVVKYLHFDKDTGSNIMSCYFGFYAASRFIGIFQAKYISSSKLAMGNFCGLLCGATMLVCLTRETYILLWFAAALVGLFLGGVFPAVTSFVNSDVLPINGVLSAFVCVAYGTGTIVHLPLVGFLFENVSPAWFAYLVLGDTITCFAAFLVLFFLNRTMQPKWTQKKPVNELIVSIAEPEIAKEL